METDPGQDDAAAIMLALGADIWVVLVGRVILTLIIIALLARLTLRWAPERAQLATENAE